MIFKVSEKLDKIISVTSVVISVAFILIILWFLTNEEQKQIKQIPPSFSKNLDTNNEILTVKLNKNPEIELVEDTLFIVEPESKNITADKTVENIITSDEDKLQSKERSEDEAKTVQQKPIESERQEQITETKNISDNTQKPHLNDQTEKIAGDVNNDGKLDIADAMLISRYLNNNYSISSEVADYNKDGKVDVADLHAICKEILK